MTKGWEIKAHGKVLVCQSKNCSGVITMQWGLLHVWPLVTYMTKTVLVLCILMMNKYLLHWGIWFHGLIKKTKIVAVGFGIQVFMLALVCMHVWTSILLLCIFHSTLKGPFPFCPFHYFVCSFLYVHFPPFKFLINLNSTFYIFFVLLISFGLMQFCCIFLSVEAFSFAKLINYRD